MVYILCLLGIYNLKVIRVLALLTLRLWNWGFTLCVWMGWKKIQAQALHSVISYYKKGTIFHDMSQNIFKTHIIVKWCKVSNYQTVDATWL